MIFAPTIAMLLVGCEEKKVTFRGEVPLFAQNQDNLSVKLNIQNNVQVIEYTFYKLPPAQGKRFLPDEVPEPKPYQFTPEEIERIFYGSESMANLRDDRLNRINERLKKLNNTPLPHELDQLTQINKDTRAAATSNSLN
ncbi:hypothetical protein [Acinetobacter indicus]|uniref:Uncharacterized protein n=1 Tax=Acinetobacter indicus TaxID=756892 RepID=A0A6C0Y6C2_9GAMM|nr:hypothetical protein [Acinetobacter indicus]QIC71797.1 hypothetical protein FSC09_15505 [Acinetobacter indicus]